MKKFELFKCIVKMSFMSVEFVELISQIHLGVMMERMRLLIYAVVVVLSLDMRMQR